MGRGDRGVEGGWGLDGGGDGDGVWGLMEGGN